MITLMLISHIIVASIMTLLSAGTLVGAHKKVHSHSAKFLMPSLGLTAGTGIALALMVPQSFGRFCITMSVATVGVFVINKYYNRQLQNSL